MYFSRYDFYEKTSSNDSDMCRTSYLCSRRRMHWILVVVAYYVGDHTFYN